MRRSIVALLSMLLVFGTSLLAPVSAQQTGKHVKVTGEIVDTWCNVSGLMFALGTAHHQCAVWCTLGGIPVSIRDKDGNFYLILRIEEDDQTVSNPRIAKIQTHEVSVEGELLERDGINYLIVTKVADDKGIINMTQAEYGIQPFGN
ncbi:hypothetical protein MCEMSEM23_01798 [Rhabdaerophilaceae bacterium]